MRSRSHPPTLLTLARRTIEQHRLVARGDRVLVAVSGGPDSMALLSVLARLAPRLGVSLVAAGVDHGLRAEAADELDLASTHAAHLEVPFERARVTVARGGNLQARARDARLAALRRLAAKTHATTIATAHHADDRAETVLMRLLSGSGPYGLACLPPREGDLVRPLTAATREDVRLHLARHGVPFAEDPSNADRRFLRARVRHELLPALVRESPSFVAHLNALADDLGRVRDVLPRRPRLPKGPGWLTPSPSGSTLEHRIRPPRCEPRRSIDSAPWWWQSDRGSSSPPPRGHVKQSQKTLLVWVVIIGLFMVVWVLIDPNGKTQQQQTFSQFMELVKAPKDKEHVESVTVKDREYTFVLVDPTKVGPNNQPQKRTAKAMGPPPGEGVTKDILEAGVRVQYEKEENNGFVVSVLVTLLPMLLLIFMFYMFMRQLQAGGGKAMSFGKSRAKLLNESQNKITFADVAGIDEAKDEVEEIIAFLKDPKKFQRLGGRIPKGVLCVGPPGTGKTLLARAIAGEAGVPFFSISGSDFVEMFVGVGASRVRDLFEQAKKHAPCIVFIDEIDAVGRHRGAGLGGGHDEREQTLNQLLVEMDGFESNEGVIIIAATNRPDVLDPAILRPGRFDRRITVPRPDVKGRAEILKVHTRKVPVAEGIDLEVIARGTPGFAGADLENLVNEAALIAARFDRDQVTMRDFEMAKDKVLMGTERRSMVISEHERKTTAWHEAGHALVGLALEPHTDPVHKVTIIPRGPALGLTQALPKEDKYSTSREQATAMLAMMMGGRVAEQLVFGQTTTGAANDIKRATQIARRMVTEFGMSEAIGPVNYAGDDEGNPFLGRDFGMSRREYSEKMAIQIDEEVRQILLTAEKTAHDVLSSKREQLDGIAHALLDRETIDAEELHAILDGKPLPEREKIVIPSWADKDKKEKDKRRGSSIFGPPRPVAS